MKIYLAGGISGNLKPAWSEMARTDISYNGFIKSLYRKDFINEEQMRIFLAGATTTGSLKPAWKNNGSYEENLKIYLADTKMKYSYCEEELKKGPYILESFFYSDKDTERLLPYFGDFMLDSGAFTFMQSTKDHTTWDEYIDRYADFIVRNKVEKFFELDIDSVVGYDQVLKLRKRLEKKTGRQSIPVWHSNRGIAEFEKSCKEYGYVALGGIVGNEWKSSHEKAMPWFIKTAHRNKAKIHALGYTKLKKLEEYHFDSVDSTAWTTGNRFGYVYRFNGRTMEKIDTPAGKRLRDPRVTALHNFTEWVKFQKYAEANL